MRSHRRDGRGQAGLTLVELLVALAVFLVVLTLASGGIIQALRVSRHNDEVASLQALARRATQVIAEEMRSLSFGAIADEPYPSGTSRISFFLPEGPAWPVYPHDSGNNASFVQAANVQIAASVDRAEDLQLAGGHALMRNGQGDAIALDVQTIARRGGPTSRTWNLVHPGCPNTIDYTQGTTILQAVDAIGYRYDADTQTIYRTTSSGEDALAFGVEAFTLQYVYASEDGDVDVRSEPHRDGDGASLRRVVIDGVAYVLDALRVEIRVSGETPFGPTGRGYALQVALPQQGPQTALRIVGCG